MKNITSPFILGVYLSISIVMELELYIVTITHPNWCDILWVFNDYSKAITLQRARLEQVKEVWWAWVIIQMHTVQSNYYLSLYTR